MLRRVIDDLKWALRHSILTAAIDPESYLELDQLAGSLSEANGAWVFDSPGMNWRTVLLS